VRQHGAIGFVALADELQCGEQLIWHVRGELKLAAAAQHGRRRE
jgi:hypothetical protein